MLALSLDSVLGIMQGFAFNIKAMDGFGQGFLIVGVHVVKGLENCCPVMVNPAFVVWKFVGVVDLVIGVYHGLPCFGAVGLGSNP